MVSGLAGIGGCSESAPDPALTIAGIAVVTADGRIDADRYVDIANGLITRVAASAEQSPRDGIRIDGRGLYLIPGLWDMHVHVTLEPAWRYRMGGWLLAHGVTSVRDTGASAAAIPWLRAQSARPDWPRILVAGPLLDGTPHVYDGSAGLPALAEPVVGPAAAQARVADLAARGVDLIKAYEMLDAETFEAILAAAAAHRLPVAAHLPLAVEARVATRSSGTLSLEHLRNLEFDCAHAASAHLAERAALLRRHVDLPGARLRSIVHQAQRGKALGDQDATVCGALIADFARRRIFHTPTLGVIAYHLAAPYADQDWPARLRSAPKPLHARLQARADAAAALPREPERLAHAQWAMSMVARMDHGGVPLLAGTDTPVLLQLPGVSLHDELELMVRAGLTPAAALRAATTTPASYFGLQGIQGEVAPGQRADLVLLEANPLENIRNTRRIAGVVTRGRYLDRAALLDLMR